MTEGTPKEIISLVEKTSSLRDYNSVKFSLGNYAEVMSSTPERVFEYPRTYYYRVLTTADGKSFKTMCYLDDPDFSTVSDLLGERVAQDGSATVVGMAQVNIYDTKTMIILVY